MAERKNFHRRVGAKIGEIGRNAVKRWNAYKHNLIIRNRITHPKKPEDLKISDGEWACFINVRAWFDGECQRLLEFRKKAQNKE